MEENISSLLSELSELNENIYRSAKKLKEAISHNGNTVHVVSELFRTFHTIKGLAGMGGFGSLSRFAHSIENLLDRIRKAEHPCTTSVINLLILSTELIDRFIDSIRTIGTDAIEENVLESFSIRLTEEIQSAPSQTESDTEINFLPPGMEKQLNDMELARLKENVRKQTPIYFLDVSFPFDSFDTDLRKIQDGINNQDGEIIATLPGEEAATDSQISFRLLLASPVKPETIRELAADSAVLKRIFTPEKQKITKSGQSKPKKPEIPPSPDKSPDERTVKVKLKELEHLLQELEELEMIKNRIEATLMPFASMDKIAGPVQQAKFQLTVLEQQIAALQKRIIYFRMVPLDSIFRRLESTTIRTAGQLGKKINLTLDAGNTKVDKQITDALVEPLVHLLRNAVDHGIEPPEDRKRKGKPAEGKITLKAYQQGNSVFIEISDDGKGIDHDKVLKKAVSSGIADKNTAYSENEILDFIFHPGFSTSENVTNISGRGVGMDVVMTEINKLGGTIQIKTAPEKGSSFSMQIPVTRAILPVFFISSGKTVLGIPSLFVKSIQPYETDKCVYVRNRLYYRLNEDAFRAVHIPRLLGVDDLDTDIRVVMQLHYFDQVLAFLVEDVKEEKEVTITPLSGKLQQLPLFSAICNFSAESVGFIFDIPQLATRLRGNHESA